MSNSSAVSAPSHAGLGRCAATCDNSYNKFRSYNRFYLCDFEHHVSICDKFEEYEWYLCLCFSHCSIYSKLGYCHRISATTLSSTLPSTMNSSAVITTSLANSSVSQLRRTNLSAVDSSPVTLSATYPLRTTSIAVTTDLAEASSAVPASPIATLSAMTTSVSTLNTLQICQPQVLNPH
jgi:hypothetical protein